jgi:hypothetical protein
MMAEVVEGIFRKNGSLDSTLIEALRKEGVGLADRMLFRWQLNRMSAEDRKKLEQEMTKLVVESGVPMPVNATIVGGVIVGSWSDFLALLLEKLPQIIEIISKFLPLFFLV